MPKNLKNIIIKKANKRSCIVIWDRNELFTGSEKKKTSNKEVYQASNSENILSK